MNTSVFKMKIVELLTFVFLIVISNIVIGENTSFEVTGGATIMREPCTRATIEKLGNTGGRYQLDGTTCLAKIKEQGWNLPTIKDSFETSTFWDYNSSEYARNNREIHTSVDVVSPAGLTQSDMLGTDIYPIYPGEVKKVSWSGSDSMNKSYLKIQHTYKKDDGKIAYFCAIYGHVYPDGPDINNLNCKNESCEYKDVFYPLTETTKGAVVRRGDIIGQIRKFRDPAHLHFSININKCLEFDSWGTLDIDNDPDTNGYVNPFNWLVDHKPSIVGLLDKDIWDKKKTPAFIETFNKYGFTQLGEHHDDNNGGLYVHEWPDTDIWLQNFRKKTGEESALILNKAGDKAHLVKEGFWDWYKTVDHNAPIVLGQPKNEEYNPSSGCSAVCNDKLLDCNIKKIEVDYLLDKEISITARQDFENGTLLWSDGKENSIFLLKKDEPLLLTEYETADAKDGTPPRDFWVKERNCNFKGLENVDENVKTAITTLCERGIVKGYGDCSFQPEKNIRRDELAKMIVIGAEIKEAKNSTKTFSDVNGGKELESYECGVLKKEDGVYSWSFGCIRDLAEAGVISGYPDGKFGPGDFGKRDQLTKMIMKSFFNDEFPEEAGSCSADILKFAKDLPEKSWYCPYLKAAFNCGIFKNDDKFPSFTDTNFGPATEVTRGEFAVLVNRALRKKESGVKTCKSE